MFYPYGGQPTGMLCSCFFLDIVMICCYEFSYIAISGLPAWRPANWDALHVCFFCSFFFFYVLLTHCYDLNYIIQFYMRFVMNLVLYINIYIYIYIYIIYVMLHHND